MTTLLEAREAIAKLINENWTIKPSKIVWDDLNEDLPGNTSYAHISVQSNFLPDDDVIGVRWAKMHGVVTIQIFTPSGIGRQQLDTYAQAAITCLRGSARNVGIERPSALSVPALTNDGYQTITVMANFYYFDER